MDTQQWLEQCKKWTDEDHRLYEIGKKSGIAINRKTGKPITLEDVIQMHESLPY